MQRFKEKITSSSIKLFFVTILVGVSSFLLSWCGGSSAQCSSDDQCEGNQVCQSGSCVDVTAFDNIKNAQTPTVDPNKISCPPEKDSSGKGCAVTSSEPPLKENPSFGGGSEGESDTGTGDATDVGDDTQDIGDDDDVEPEDKGDTEDTGSVCVKDEDCMEGTTPKCNAPDTNFCICEDSKCREGCLADENCYQPTPVCNANTRYCCGMPECPQQCQKSEDCTYYDGLTYCDTDRTPAICVAPPAGCNKNCPTGMTLVWATDCGKAYCMDVYEASADATDPTKAASVVTATPWVNVTWDEARAACQAAGKDLCTEEQWKTACDGKHGLGENRKFSYGDAYEQGKCNDSQLNDHALETGSMPDCHTPADAEGKEVVYDMTGNVAEWVMIDKTPPSPAMIGGSYLDGCPSGPPCSLSCSALVPIPDGNQPRPSIGFRCCSATQ